MKLGGQANSGNLATWSEEEPLIFCLILGLVDETRCQANSGNLATWSEEECPSDLYYLYTWLA